MAAVEFALIAPLFFLLVFGIFQFGRMIMVQQVLTNASREGARLGVLSGTAKSDVVTAVTGYLTNAKVQGAGLAVTVKVVKQDGSESDTWPPGYDESVKVSVSIPFREVMWVPTPFFRIDPNLALSAVTVMRAEAVAQ